MKITIFISSMTNSGGVERVASNLADLFVSNGHEMQILVLRSSLETFYELPSAVAIHSLNIDKRLKNQTKIGYAWNIITSLRAYMCAERPDVMLAIWTDLAVFNILAGLGLKTKVIACEHTDSNRKLVMHEKLRRFVYPLADGIVALTDADQAIYRRMNRNSAVIPNIVKIPAVQQDINKEKTILSIGNIAHNKGFDLLIEAWHIAHTQLTDWKLKIIGAALDESYKKRLADMLEVYNLNDTVTIAPAIKNVFPEYKKASIFVLASRREGLPTVIVEAMFLGLPVISFDCPTGPRELIEDGYNGTLVENNNVEALARAIVELAQDEDLQNRYIANARIKASIRFSENCIYEQWMKLFKSL